MEKERQMQTVLVINVPINLFLDDTSANRSKRWMPLHCVQMQPSGVYQTKYVEHRFLILLLAIHVKLILIIQLKIKGVIDSFETTVSFLFVNLI